MKIKEITIVKTHGSDKVLLHTNLVEATYPYTGELVLSFEAAYDDGLSYVKKAFPDVAVKVIDRS